MAKITKNAMRELGVPGLKHYGGLVQEHWIKSLNTHDKRIKVYDEMYRYDPTASAMMKTTQMFMCGSRPKVKAASTSRADVEAAEFLESALFDMTKSWQEIMADIALFLVYGYFDMEIVYWQRDGEKSKFEDGRIGWRKWAPRHPRTLGWWEFDDHGGLQAMVQQGPPNYKTIKIPIEKLLHFTTTGMGKNSPEGDSIMDGAYTAWYFAKNLTIEEAIVIERLGGTPKMSLPEDASDDDAETAEKIVRNIKTCDDMGVVEPFGFEFSYEMPSRGPAIEPGAVIMRHRRSLARTLMMDFIMLGGGDQGSWAMHKDKSALYIRGLNTYMGKVADVINRHGVPRLFSLNAFPGITGLPEVYFTPITKIDIGDFSEVIARLFNSGALSYDMETENTVRREIGLPEVKEPGLSFKQPTPLEFGPPPEEPKPEDTEDEEEEEEKEDSPEDEDSPDDENDDESEMSEFAEVVGGMSHGEAVSYTNSVGQAMVSDYDDIIEKLAEKLAETSNEDEWVEQIELAFSELDAAMIARLREAYFDVFRRAVGSPPDIESLRVILEELEFQYGYMENSLKPDIKRKVLDKRQDTKRDSASRAVIILALIGAAAAFRYRVSMYGGSTYKIWAKAHAKRVYQRMKPRADRLGLDISLDLGDGMVYGDDVLARYAGPDDERTCAECHEWVQRGWVKARPGVPPPIGSLACSSNCRHRIEFKVRGRIYR